MSLVISRRKIS